MTRVFLGLGSNMGDRAGFLSRGVGEIAKRYTIVSESRVYETEPWGEKGQNNFFNAVIEIVTDESPFTIFLYLKSLEKEIGRMERGKWKEREIDIDILFYGNETIETPDLFIPHKEIENRRFVLAPLAELAPGFIHPVLQKTIQQLLTDCTDNSHIQTTTFRLYNK